MSPYVLNLVGDVILFFTVAFVIFVVILRLCTDPRSTQQELIIPFSPVTPPLTPFPEIVEEGEVVNN